MRVFPRVLVVLAILFGVEGSSALRGMVDSPSARVNAQGYCYDVTLGFYPYTHARVCPPVGRSISS